MNQNACAALLEAIADCRERMIDMAVRLRDAHDVTTAVSGLDIRHYKSGGTRIEAYVDAELQNGRAISWWLEFRWVDGQWLIEASVNVNGPEGQRTVDEIGSWRVDSVEHLMERLASTVTLLASRSTATEVFDE